MKGSRQPSLTARGGGSGGRLASIGAVGGCGCGWDGAGALACCQGPAGFTSPLPSDPAL